MRPGLVGLDVFAVGETDADRVKGDDQVLGTVDLFKCLDDLGLLTHTPGEGFVGDGVAQTHALFVDVGEMILVNGGWVISFEAQTAVVFEVLKLEIWNGKKS